MKAFLYFLVEEDGRTRQIVNGVVTSLNTAKALPLAPDGWQDILIAWERDMEKHGNIRNFSLPMAFVEDGMKILRNDFYKFNGDRKLFLLIKRFVSEIDATNYKEYYKFFYKGELDFSKGLDKQTEEKFEINILEGGLAKLLKSQETTEFEIPFDSDAIVVKHTGIKLTGKYVWRMLETQGGSDHLVGMVLIGQEQKAPGIAVFDVQETYAYPPNNVDENSLDYFLHSNTNIDGEFGWFYGDVEMKNPDPGQVTWFDIHIWNTITGSQKPTVHIYTGPRTQFININFGTFVIEPGDRLFLSSPDEYFEFDLTFQIKTKHPDSLVYYFKPFDLYKKLVAKITGNPIDAESDLLQESSFCLTSGDALRGIVGSSIKTSLKNFYKAMDVYHMAGMGVRNKKAKLEHRLYFYNIDIVGRVNLVDCRDMVITLADELIYNSIKVGHAEQNIDDVNGKYDFNGYQIYTTPVKFGGDRQMDLQSPYKAGPYEIEITRINFEGKTTTDSGKDNQVFVADINLASGVAIEYDAVKDVEESYPSPSDVNFDTASGGLLQANGTNSQFTLLGTIAQTAILNLVITLANITTDAIVSIKVNGVVLASVVIPAGVGNNTNGLTNVNVTLNPADVLVVNVQTIGGGSYDVINAQLNVDFTTAMQYLLDRSIEVNSGVPDPPSIFNVRLSPKRILNTHARWVRSFLFNYEPGEVKFELANRNKDLVAGGITESANVDISAMGQRIFLPYYMDFGVSTPINLVDTMDNNIDMPFVTDWKNVRWEAFLKRGALAPSTRQPQEYKLLLTAQNDVTKLI